MKWFIILLVILKESFIKLKKKIQFLNGCKHRNNNSDILINVLLKFLLIYNIKFNNATMLTILNLILKN